MTTPSLYNLNALKKIVDEALDGLVTRISVDYKLDIHELKQKYFGESVDSGEQPSSSNNANGNGPKKKGRKKKVQDNVIETVEYTYEDITYLVDKNNNVYTYNLENPTMVGKKLVDGTIKFHKKYAPAHSSKQDNPLFEKEDDDLDA